MGIQGVVVEGGQQHKNSIKPWDDSNLDGEQLELMKSTFNPHVTFVFNPENEQKDEA